jgi:hypothetical protein
MRGFARRNGFRFVPDWRANHHGARLSAIPILLALLLALAGPARAQDAPVEYAQRGVPAEATAENGVVARDRALASARRIAWERLAGSLGGAARSLPDSAVEGLVESIVIEQERTAPTRYTGRVTVNFSRARVQAALGGGGDPALAGGGIPGAAAAASAPAVASVVAVARYGGMSEWLELRRRLATAPQVARVEVVAIAVDRARLRLSLRAPTPVAAEQLAQSGIILAPQAGPTPIGATAAADAWRVGLAGRL